MGSIGGPRPYVAWTRARVFALRHGLALKALTGLVAVAYVLYGRRRGVRGEAGGGVGGADGEAPPCDVLVNPAWAPRLSSLRELSLAGCGLESVPEAIGRCVNLEKLDLARNDLVDLPEALARLERLEVLFVLGARRMVAVPAVLARLPALTRLGLRSNGLAKLEGARLPPNLVHAIFTDNKIASIDEAAYAKFRGVKKLMLANNALTSFTGGARPATNLGSLELLRLANNDLGPDGLGALLTLPRLAWIALAGNPRLLGVPPTWSSAVPTVDMGDVDASDGEVLGAGASGEVTAVAWRGETVALKRLAVKSSDGRATDELAVIRALGARRDAPESLVRAVAVVEEPPAVLMEKLPKGARDLAKPPTIKEVSRDRYPDGERFSPDFALRVATELAAAVAFLHAHDVAHGDVYGHNTLVHDASKTVKLGDFGAAFYYGNVAADVKRRFAKVEARALGVLIAELATRVVGDADLKAKLLAVADAALDADVDKRPDPAAVLASLRGFAPSPP